MTKPQAYTPREIVSELDRYIVGQHDAKRAVAIALRNRWRRQQVPEELREEIAPKNIIMIGSTGVGKTEIARRLAKLAQAPFIKVEASKFTEVGYVGRDVESIIRDLADLAVQLVTDEQKRTVTVKAEKRAEERVLDALLPPPTPTPGMPQAPGVFPMPTPGAGPTVFQMPAPSAGPTVFQMPAPGAVQEAQPEPPAEAGETREKLRQWLRDGKLDDREIDVEVADGSGAPSLSVFTPQGVEEMGVQFKDMLGGMFGGKTKTRRLKVPAALEVFSAEEAGKLVDMDQVRELAVERVEQAGIVFIDEIDKVASGGEAGRAGGVDISREGVQRDLLPIVEGSTVQTKHGPVRTDHILFVAAGAFHVAKPSDLIPELQGRFPIRVELESLTQADFVRILTEPQNSLVRQYTALLETEGVTLEFSEDGVEALAEIAATVNERTDDIGARRLHTLLERVLDEVSFEAPDRGGSKVRVDRSFVEERLSGLVQDEDLSRFIL
ncbi:MAG: ATP-dependent protease ATPase subunit HslU [Deltaproteobacteria bacterium]|nr:ATP-dependent protease ATPase subunit HslU [Deltaproteobacteria bacterium]